jgi:signal transduction histidine kinase
MGIHFHCVVVGRRGGAGCWAEYCPQLQLASASSGPMPTAPSARRKDGSIFWIGMVLTRLRQSTHGAIRCLAIGADITGRLEQERTKRLLQEQLVNAIRERERVGIELRLARKLESVGRLAVGIAHEINTPIQYIGASVSFLQMAQADLMRLLNTYRSAFQQLTQSESSQGVLERVRIAEQGLDSTFLGQEIPRAFERALVGVERVAAIVRAMKEFAQPNTFEQYPADLNRAIQTMLVVASHEYRYCAQIETRFGELPPVMCNLGELNHVFLHLIVNAAHAIAESGKSLEEGQISITTAVFGDSIEISVADNGCGIPPESVGRIFDPCFTTKPPDGCTGQGLATTRAIVTERHGGSIDVHSTVGGGTRVILRLPIAGRPAAGAT